MAFQCTLPVDTDGRDQSNDPSSYSLAEIENMKLCISTPSSHCITVQQPPKVSVRRFTVTKKKLIQSQQISYREREVKTPYLTYIDKVCKLPKIIHYFRVLKTPRIDFHEQLVTDPTIMSVKRMIIEPLEVCESLLCQPKHQVIAIPEPEYFDYFYGPYMSTTNSCPAPNSSSSTY